MGNIKMDDISVRKVTAQTNFFCQVEREMSIIALSWNFSLRFLQTQQKLYLCGKSL